VPIILAVVVVILDQAAKYFVQSNMLIGMSIPVINNIFHLTYILNPGAAFGIFEHQTLVFIIIAVGLFIAAIYYYPRIPAGYRLLRVGVGLLMGGAAGNLIDRIKTGFVVDYLDFRVWPVFNIADIAIVAGVSLIIYILLYKPDKRDEQL